MQPSVPAPRVKQRGVCAGEAGLGVVTEAAGDAAVGERGGGGAVLVGREVGVVGELVPPGAPPPHPWWMFPTRQLQKSHRVDLFSLRQKNNKAELSKISQQSFLATHSSKSTTGPKLIPVKFWRLYIPRPSATLPAAVSWYCSPPGLKPQIWHNIGLQASISTR